MILNRLFAALTIALLPTTAALAKGAPCPMPTVSYSAQMSVKSTVAPGQPPVNLEAKMYFSNKRLRVEMNQGGMLVVAITDENKKRVLMLMPQMKQYVQAPLETKGGFNPMGAGSVCELKPLGKEVVAGMKTTKYRVVAKGPGAETTGTMWMTKDKILVKLVGKSRQEQGGKKVSVPVSMSLKNVKVGPVPEKLFQVPKGYKKASVPGMTGAPAAK